MGNRPTNIKGVKGFQPKQVEDGGVHTGTEAWNIAQYYTGFSIAVPLRELNELEDIARFGTLRMDDDIIMSDDRIEKRRADALQRYWNKLKQIILDTIFKVKHKDKKEAQEIYDRVVDCAKYFDALLEVREDAINHDDKIILNEKFFALIIDYLNARKREYLYVLDRTGLIFRETDEVDLDKLSSDFVHGG